MQTITLTFREIARLEILLKDSIKEKTEQMTLIPSARLSELLMEDIIEYRQIINKLNGKTE